MTDQWEPEPLPTREEITDEWMKYGACATADPDAFFPEAAGTLGKEAKAVCAVCDVREKCLQYALDHNERYGIWGGLSVNQRSRLRNSITNPKEGNEA